MYVCVCMCMTVLGVWYKLVEYTEINYVKQAVAAKISELVNTKSCVHCFNFCKIKKKLSSIREVCRRVFFRKREKPPWLHTQK